MIPVALILVGTVAASPMLAQTGIETADTDIEIIDGLVDRSSRVEVTGPTRTEVEAVRVSDRKRIGAATTDAQGHTFIDVPRLSVDDVYMFRVSSKNKDLGGTLGVPIHRFGSAEAMTRSITPRPVGTDALGIRAYRGNDLFSINLWVDHEPADIKTRLVAYLAIGTKQEITEIDSELYFLDSPFVVPTRLSIFHTQRPGHAVVRLPIPDDARLVGTDVMFQWWTRTGPSKLHFSEVFGVRIRDREFEPSASHAARDKSNSAIEEDPQAVGQWLKSLPSVAELGVRDEARRAAKNR